MTISQLFVVLWHLVKENDDIRRSHKVDVTYAALGITQRHKSIEYYTNIGDFKNYK